MKRKQSLKLFLSILKDNCRIETDSGYGKAFKEKPISSIAIFGSCIATMLLGIYYFGFNQPALLAMLGLWMCICIIIIRTAKKLKTKKQKTYEEGECSLCRV